MMKKLIARLLLFFIVFSQLQIGDLYVSAKQDILSAQNSSIQELEKFEQAFDVSIKKVDKKLKNKKKKQKLKQKEKEIKQLMKDAKKQLKKEKNKEKIKKIKQDTKNRSLLKMTSGVLDYKNIEENLKGDLKNNKKKKQKALKTLKKSLKKNNAYSVMLSGDFSRKELMEKYKIFDEKIKVKKLYKKGEKTYFLITFRKNSILQEELFENIESGELPDNFLGLEVIQPEIFTIDSLDLQGEDLSQTRGIEQYATYTHFDNLDTSKKIKVGVIDTGIDYTHSDLQHSVNTSIDKDFVNADDDAMDNQGHGTHVAGIIGANINQQGIIGINPYVELVPLRICDENGFCPSYALVEAIAYAKEQKIDILNMSLGGRADAQNHPVCEGISSFVDTNGIVITAAGNSNIPADQFVPGGCDNTITVGAYDKNKSRAVFSNYGPAVDISAPGTKIYSTSLNNSYKELSGTSMAAPHITGLASLLLSKDDTQTQSELLSFMQSYPLFLNTHGDNKTIGNGVNTQDLFDSFQVQDENDNTDETETNQGENIAEYIQDYIEEVDTEEYDNPETIHYPLDDLTIEDVQLEINEHDQIFEPEIFNLNPTIHFDQIVVNNIENETEYQNEDTQNFTIVTDDQDDFEIEEEGNNLNEHERILLPEVISNGPKYTSETIELDNPFTDKNSDIEINNINNEIIHTETIEGDIKNLQKIDNHIQDSNNTNGTIENISIDELLYNTGSQNDEDLEVIEYKIETIDTEKILNIDYNFSDIIYDPLEETNTGEILGDGELEILDNYPEQKDNFGIQNIESCEIEILKQSCSFRLSDSWSYQFHDENPGIVGYTWSSKYLYFYGVGTGSTTISLFQNNTLARTYNITVNDTVGGDEYFTYPEGTESWVTVRYLDRYNVVLSAGLQKGKTTSSSIKLNPMKPGNHTVTVLEKATGKLIKKYHYEIIPNPPTVHEKILYVGDYSNSLYDPYYFRSKDFSVSKNGVISLEQKSNWLYIRAINSGYVEAYVKEGDILRNIFKITVKDIPTPVDLYCKVKAGESCTFDIPESSEHSIGTYSSTHIQAPILSNSGTTLQVQTITNRYYQNTNFQVLGERGFPIANIDIDITPDAPQYECHMVKGGYCELSLRYAEGYYPEISTEGIFNYFAYDDTIKITGIEVGEAKVEVRDKNHYYLADITVYVYNPELVSLQEVDCEISGIGNTCEIDFLSSNIFQYTVSEGGIIQTSTAHNKIKLQSLKLGSTKVFVKFGDITIGTINVTVGTQAKKYKCELNVDKECDIYLGKYITRMSFETDTPGIVELYTGGNRGRYLYLKAKQTGSVNLYIRNSKYRRYEAQVEVIVTEPTRTTCTILEGEKCNLEGLPKYFNYEVQKDGVRVGRYRNDSRNHGTPMYVNLSGYTQSDGKTVRTLEGLRSGKVEFHIYKLDYSNEYLLHVIEVEILEAPIDSESFCNTRVNGSCQITLRNIGTDKYTIQVSEGGYTQMVLKRDYLYMRGTNEGSFEVFITNNETGEIVHRGQVEIKGFYKISVPRPETKLSETNISFQVGESQIVNILEGNKATNYRVVSGYPNLTVSRLGTTGFKITAENNQPTTGIIYLIDAEKEYSSAKIYVNITQDGSGDTGGGSNDNPGDNDNQTLGFQDFAYEALNDIEIGFVHFKVTGNPTQVGIQYITQDNTVAQEILTPNDNGLYSLVIDKNISPDATTAYDNFMPFYKDENNDVYYYNTDNYLSFSSTDGKGRVLDNVGVESFGLQSAETEEEKEKIYTQLTKDGQAEVYRQLIEKLNNFSLNLKTKIDNKFNDLNERISFTNTLISKFNELENKYGNTTKGLFIQYVSINFEEYIEGYEKSLFNLESNSYFKNAFATELSALSRQLEMDIELKAMLQKGITRKYLDQQYGGMFSKESLDFLLLNSIITSEEHAQYRTYNPNIDGIINSLSGIDGFEGMLISYFPDQLGANNGTKQAIQDYVTGMIEVLDPRDVPELLTGIYKALQSVNLENAQALVAETYELYESIDEILAGLPDYDKAYYKSYLKTTIGLAIVPVSRLKTVNKLKGEDSKVMGEIKEIKWYKPVHGGKTIDGIYYTEHVLARMAPKGSQYLDSKGDVIDGRGIPSIVVKNALNNGNATTGTQPDTLDIVYDNIFLVTSSDKKRIITIMKKNNE